MRHAPGLLNFWGYSPLAWMSVNRRYAEDSARPGGPIDEFRSILAECKLYDFGTRSWVGYEAALGEQR